MGAGGEAVARDGSQQSAGAAHSPYDREMFGRKRTPTQASMFTAGLVQLIAEGSVEIEAKNEAAMRKWGIGSANTWAADLAAGTITFEFDDRSITGPVQVLGTFGRSSSSWLWGWANQSLPENVTSASRSVQLRGGETGLEALALPKLELTEAIAGDLAALSVKVAGLAGMYRAPTTTGFVYLGFTDFRVIEAEGSLGIESAEK